MPLVPFYFCYGIGKGEKEMSDMVYYKRNVNYVVGGRHFIGDTTGFSLNAITPYVAVKRENLREFKIANKQSIMDGLIVETGEPSVDWETDNAVTDEQAKELVRGNFIQLKQRIESITSLSTASKILDIAKQEDRPVKTIKLLESKVAELTPEEEDFQRGVE